MRCRRKAASQLGFHGVRSTGVGRRGPAIIFSLVASLPLVHIANAHVLQLRYFQGGRIANDVVGRMETAIDEPEGREAGC